VGYSPERKAAVLEMAEMNEAALAEYCRKRGLYPAQISVWRAACEQATDWDRASTARLGQVIKKEKKRIKDLERELARKEKALAETAARLVLRKKAHAIWGAGPSRRFNATHPPTTRPVHPARSGPALPGRWLHAIPDRGT
jgi:transposase-like protein